MQISNRTEPAGYVQKTVLVLALSFFSAQEALLFNDNTWLHNAT